MKSIIFSAVCFAALLVGQAATASTHIKITNNGPGDLTVVTTTISTVLQTGDHVETDVTANNCVTATAGDTALNFHVRDFGPNDILITNGTVVVGVAPGFGLGVNAAANASYVICEMP